jgi:universal stress protein A
MFQTIIHPTDFDSPSIEAFRVARSLAQAVGAKLVVFHVVAPPALVTHDGMVIREPHQVEPEDLWAEYRALASDTSHVPIRYAVVVGDKSASRHLLDKKIRELGGETLVVMGSHGRRGLRRFLWGSKAEELVRECPCAVLVVKAAPANVAATASLSGVIAGESVQLN